MKLSEQSFHENTTVISVPANTSELSIKELKHIDTYYMENNAEYKAIVHEYNKDKVRNRREKRFEVFPSKDEWSPSERILDSLEKQLLCGPSSTVTKLKQVQKKAPETSRWITYTCMHHEENRRVSSSYVCASNANNMPQFGQITKLICHAFMEKNTIFAEVSLFSTAKYDAELAMWFINHDLKQTSQLYALEELSDPLVVANDKESSTTWFLNYI